MKEKIGRLARGIVDTNLPIIHITPDKINEKIIAGNTYKAELNLKSEERLRFRGLIYSTNERVALSTGSFAGSFEYVGFTVDAQGLSEGDAIKGEFQLVTNAGEMRVPYKFSICEAMAEPAANETKNSPEPEITNTQAAPIEPVISDNEGQLEFNWDMADEGDTTFDISLDSNHQARKALVSSEKNMLYSLIGVNAPEIDYKLSYQSRRACFTEGCDLPYLYLETIRALNAQPRLLESFDLFNLRAVNFGARYCILSDEIKALFYAYAHIDSSYNSLVINTLIYLYKTDASDEALKCICEKLISDDRKDDYAFSWYSLATHAGVNVTRLYDYYLMAMPQLYKDRLPEEVYHYYSYDAPNFEDDKKKLYFNIIKNFDTESATYKAFAPQMRTFAIDALTKNKIDYVLGLIYERFLSIDLVDERNAVSILDLAISYEISGLDSAAKNIIITYDELTGDQVVPYADDTAIFPLYTPNYSIKAVDKDGAELSLEGAKPYKLIDGAESLIATCTKFVPDIPSFIIKKAHDLLSLEVLSFAEAKTLYDLSLREGLSARFITEIKRAVLTRYNWTFDAEHYDMLLDCASDKGLLEEDRVVFINILIGFDRLDEADAQIKRIGYEKFDKNQLLKTLTSVLTDTEYAFEQTSLDEAIYLYKSGVYNSEIITYICTYYNGLCADMYELLMFANAHDFDSADLAERLLGQKLFCEDYDDIDTVFRIYAGRGSVNKNLLYAYYVIKCSRYFLNDEPIDPEIFDAIKELLSEDIAADTAPVILRLAVTKHYSQLDSLSKEDEIRCKKMITALTQKGIIFPYVKKLSRLIELPEEIKDKTMISYNGHEGDKVVLIITPDDDDEEPIYLDMNYVYAGIFVKPILLFKGEHESYQIRVTRDDESFIAQSGELFADITDDGSERRFIRLNNLIEESANPSDEDWQAAMLAYAEDEALTNELFTV